MPKPLAENELLSVIKRGECPCWVHNAAITGDIEALRAIALWHADWWNNSALPALAKTGKDGRSCPSP